MKLNVSKVLAAERERKARVLPLPIIRSKRTVEVQYVAPVKKEPEITITIGAEVDHAGMDKLSKESALLLLEIEMRALKVERAKLSNAIPKVIEEVTARLTKEGPAIADEFLKGNIRDHQVRAHYHKIQSVTDQMMVVYDKINHVKIYGALPVPVETQNLASVQSSEAKSIKYEIRRLDDLIYKSADKIKKAKSGLKAPKNSERVNTWRETIAMAETRRDDLKMKLKQIRYARTEVEN